LSYRGMVFLAAWLVLTDSHAAYFWITKKRIATPPHNVWETHTLRSISTSEARCRTYSTYRWLTPVY